MTKNFSNYSMSHILPWIIGLTLVTLAIYAGGYSLITVDTLYKIEISKMMLNGKMMYKDLFEVNHPMPTYIIWIAVYIASKFSWLNDVFATKALLCSLCLLSVILSHKVMVLSDEYKDKYFRFIFIITLFYVTFLLPMHYSDKAELGQKTHLFFILFLPYLYSFLLTDTQRKQHPYLMLIVGLFAGIGLCVKVYFFVIAAILEIARMLNRKSFTCAFRIETFAVAFVAASFLLSILILTPEYITEVIPIANIGYAGYSSRAPNAWLYFLLDNAVIFIFPIIFIAFRTTSIKAYSPKYARLIIIAMIASLFSIVPQASKWDHASLPTLGFIMLFVAMILSDISRSLIEKLSNKNHKYETSSIFGFLIIILTLILITQSLTNNIKNYKTRATRFNNDTNQSYFLSLSKIYGNKGGAHFLTKTFQPGLHTWINGNFSLQSYFYNAYIVDGLRAYKEMNQNKKSSKWMKENFQPIEDEVRERIINGIKNQKPALIIVQDGYRAYDKLKQETYMIFNKVNYLDFLREDKRFKKVWGMYQLKETVGRTNSKQSPIFSVYIRRDLT